MPSLRPEIKAEIVALDVQIADLILRSQGNYRELEELAEVLDNCLDSCELNLNSIRIIANDSPSDHHKELCSLKDLPIELKQLIYSCSHTNSVLLSLLSEITNRSVESLVAEIATQSEIYSEPVTVARVEEWMDELMKASKSDKTFFFKRM